MTESSVASAEGTATVAIAEPLGFGPTLALARERAGLSVQDVAARLRLSVQQVRALEAGSLSELPVAAYVRGFIRSYARVVHLDAEPLLADFNRRTMPAPSTVDLLTSQRTQTGDGHSSRRVVMVIGVLVLIALGTIGWYANPPRSVGGAPTPATTPSSMAQAAVPDAAATPSPTLPAPPPVDASATDARSGTDTPVAIATASVADVTMAAAGSAPAAPTTALSMAFDGPCWVQVMHDGRVIHEQIYTTGGQSQLDGPLPMSVTLGDGRNARVWLRGEALDLATVMRGNVARFTVGREVRDRQSQ